MRALVTGAAGFIGRVLCAELRRRGHQVIATVRRPVADIDADRIAIVPDITDATDWGDLLDDLDVVFHLAAHVHVLDRAASRDLERFRAVNVGGTEALARAASRAGVKRFVFLSTIGVHGAESGERPLREDDPQQPVTPYGISKKEAEERLFALRGDSPMSFTILRAPLVYGPRVEAKFRQLVGLVRRGVPLPFGLVRNARSFVFVDNLVDAMIAAATSNAAANDVYFVADRESWSTPALIRALAAAMHRPARLLPIPDWLLAFAARLTGQRERLLPILGTMLIDTTKFERATGWSQPYSAEEGLRRTVQ